MRAAQNVRRLTPRGKSIQAIQSRLLGEASGSDGKDHDNCFLCKLTLSSLAKVRTQTLKLYTIYVLFKKKLT
jgi:hypothetical protein